MNLRPAPGDRLFSKRWVLRVLLFVASSFVSSQAHEDERNVPLLQYKCPVNPLSTVPLYYHSLAHPVLKMLTQKVRDSDAQSIASVSSISSITSTCSYMDPSAVEGWEELTEQSGVDDLSKRVERKPSPPFTCDERTPLTTCFFYPILLQFLRKIQLSVV